MAVEVRVSPGDLETDFEQVFDELGERGDLVWVDVGEQRFLLVNGADEVGEVLVERSDVLVKPRVQSIEVGPPAPERSDGAIPVQQFRRALARAMTGSALADAAVVAVADAVAGESAEWQAGRTLELMPALRRLAIRSVATGPFASYLTAPDVEAVGAALRWFDGVPRVTSPKLRSRRRFTRHGLRARYVQERLAGAARRLEENVDRSRPSELTAVLVDLAQIAPDLPEARRVQLVGELLLGAAGPLTQTAGWSLLRLAEEPFDLRAEWARVLGDEPVTAAALSRLPRTEAFVREVTRLHPTNPRITRAANGDTKVGGEPVPAHTRVVLNVNRLNRDPRFYGDPDRFDPDRWLRGRPNAHKFAYVSFGVGERRCLGEAVAVAALAALLAELGRRFEIHFESVRVSTAGRHQLEEGTRAALLPAG
jgi:cytochrome P450